MVQWQSSDGPTGLSDGKAAVHNGTVQEKMNNTTHHMTRRTFLSAGAAALAGAATLKAGAGITAGMKGGAPLRVAVAGCGARGMLLLEGLRVLAAGGVPVRVTAVAEADPARRQAAASQVPALLAHWRDCLVRDDVDAVVVALPDDLHASAALEALRLGRHVYLETPVARSLGEAQLLAKTAQASGAVVEVGAAECALPAWRVAEDLVRAGRIGRVHWCHSVAASGTRGVSAGWRAQRDRSQGPAAQLHCDQLMPLLHTLDPDSASSASTVGGRWDASGDTPDSLMSTIRFGDALSVNLVSSTLNSTGQRPMLRGELGSIEVFADGVMVTPEQGAEEWIAAPAGPFTAEQWLLRDWVDSIRGGHGPLCPLALGLAAQQALDLSLSAWRDGHSGWQA